MLIRLRNIRAFLDSISWIYTTNFIYNILGLNEKAIWVRIQIAFVGILPLVLALLIRLFPIQLLKEIIFFNGAVDNN